MTAGRQSFTKTMRIDLIPDAPSEPVAGGRRRILVTRIGARAAPKPPAEPDGQRSQYQELLQNVYDAALVTNLNGRIADVNLRALDFLQYTREQLCGLTIFDVISGADDTLIATIWESLQNERHALIQAYCIRSDGSFFPAEIAVNKLNLGQMHLCFFLRDTTLRRQAEDMLMTEHNAIQNAGNGIAVANLSGDLEYVNPATGVLWGCGGAQLVGAAVGTLFEDPGRIAEIIRSLSEGQGSWNGDLVAVRKSGERFDVQVGAACSRNADGEPLGIVFSFIDMTDRKRAEEALRVAERRRVMLESFGAACHHLSQPSTVLMGNLEIMKQRLLADDPKVCDLFKSSLNAMETIGAILHKLTAVTEYKTQTYLDAGSRPESAESRIVEI